MIAHQLCVFDDKTDSKSKQETLHVVTIAHEITAVNLSKIYCLKNAKKTRKPNKRDLNRD